MKIERLLERDNTTVENIAARMKNQWSDNRKTKLADAVIENINLEKTKKIVQKLHKKLSKAQ